MEGTSSCTARTFLSATSSRVSIVSTTDVTGDLSRQKFSIRFSASEDNAPVTAGVRGRLLFAMPSRIFETRTSRLQRPELVSEITFQS